MKHIRFCKVCREFTLGKNCGRGHETVLPNPPRYSPLDKYGAYRRKLKKPSLLEKGLL